MTESEMLEAEKYWCENCLNWDKEHVLMDGYAKCKLTGTLCFAQESGKECKFFDVAEENIIVTPCKVGDTVYALWETPTKTRYVIYCAEVKEIRRCKKNNRLATIYRLESISYRGRIREYYDSDFGVLVFSSYKEAEAHLRKEDEGK